MPASLCTHFVCVAVRHFSIPVAEEASDQLNILLEAPKPLSRAILREGGVLERLLTGCKLLVDSGGANHAEHDGDVAGHLVCAPQSQHKVPLGDSEGALTVVSSSSRTVSTGSATSLLHHQQSVSTELRATD
jgi:hypothetical protein